MPIDSKLVEVERLAKKWRNLAGEPSDWVTPNQPTDTAIRTAGRATMIQCAAELEALFPVISRLLDAAHADALRAAAGHAQHHLFAVDTGLVVESSCACGARFPTQGSCEAWKAHILALTPEHARLERELGVARAVLMVQEAMNDLIQGGRDFGIKSEAGNHVVESRKHVADLEAKLAALEGQSQLK